MVNLLQTEIKTPIYNIFQKKKDLYVYSFLILKNRVNI